MAQIGRLSPTDRAAFLKTSQNLGLNPYEFGGLIQLESRFQPNIIGGEGNNYRGLIQFGPGARQEVGLPSRDMTIAEQLPYVERYFQQRGYQPGMGIQKAYATVLGGNPDANINYKDAFGTSVASAVPRMKEGGDLYKTAQQVLGPLDTQSYGGASAAAGGLDMKSEQPKPVQSGDKPDRPTVADGLLSQSLGMENKPELTKKNFLANSLVNAALQSLIGNSSNPFGGLF